MFITPVYLYSQNNNESIVSPQVNYLFNKSTPNADETYRLGIQILKLAKTSKEYSYGYSLIADGLRKKEDYSRALFFYKKVDSISTLLNDFDRRFMSNLFMTGIYNSVGLLSRANESLSLSQFLKEKATVQNGRFYLLLVETNWLEMSYKYCQAISKRKELLNLITALNEKKSSEESFVVALHALLAYDYIKCRQMSNAKLHIYKADSIMGMKPGKINSIVMPSYKMVKGVYAAENNNLKMAKLLFDEALRNSRKNNLHNERIRILEERLNYNFDEPTVRKSLIEEKNVLRLKRTAEAAKIIEYEQDYRNTLISTKETYIQLLFISIVISVIIIFFLLRRSTTKNRITQNRFKQLIEQIKARDLELEIKNTLTFENLQDDKQSVETILLKSEIPNKQLLSEEKELDLLAKLKCFECGKEFLNSNYSISMMAAQFETNSKYINFILHQHRSKLFSDYINSLRINYITKQLYQKPSYLNYKISYLSELSGFSSHSRFASIFKKETGISPSDFITQLLRENASTDEDIS